MFFKKIKLFKLFGFEVSIDLSWIFIVILIVWSLGAGLFSRLYPGLPGYYHWVMGVIGAVGLFCSIIFHELWHSLVARKYGLPMKGITLFFFGGVAEMTEEPPNPKSELMMALAGPAASVILGLLFTVAFYISKSSGWPLLIQGILGYLAMINFILVVFNLVPAFPLDGGRILRAILWGWKKNLPWATKVASRIGSGFGIFLILLGVFNVLTGNFVGGMWWFLIGIFIRTAASSSRQQLLTKQALAGEPLSKFMKKDPVTAPPDITLEKLVNDYIYKYHYKMFPVVESDRLVGCITTRDVKNVPRQEWGSTEVRTIARGCSDNNTISPDVDAFQALKLMHQTENSRLMVIENNRLVGVISLKDMLRFLALKIDLEE